MNFYCPVVLLGTSLIGKDDFRKALLTSTNTSIKLGEYAIALPAFWPLVSKLKGVFGGRL